MQEAAQYRAEAQASRKMLEHQKSIARVSPFAFEGAMRMTQPVMG